MYKENTCAQERTICDIIPKRFKIADVAAVLNEYAQRREYCVYEIVFVWVHRMFSCRFSTFSQYIQYIYSIFSTPELGAQCCEQENMLCIAS